MNMYVETEPEEDQLTVLVMDHETNLCACISRIILI